MSYILDALKRADAERQRGQIPGLHAHPANTVADQPGLVGRPLWLAGVGVLSLGALAVWWWMARSPAASEGVKLAQVTPAPAPRPAPAPALATTSAPSPAPAAAPDPTPAPNAPIDPATAVPVPRPPPPLPSVPEGSVLWAPGTRIILPTFAQQGTLSAPIPMPDTQPSGAPPPVTPTSPPAPGAQPVATPPVAPIAAPPAPSQAQTSLSIPAVSLPAAASPAPETSQAVAPAAVRRAAQPVPAPQQVQQPPRTVANQPSASPAGGATPGLPPLAAELPDNLRGQLPPLTITGSIYSDTPSQRLLLINGLVLRQGGSPAKDLTIEEIRAGSTVFSFRGTRFRLAH